MSGLFGRHGRTFARAIRRQEYQRTEDGILFPRLGAFLAGEVIARTRHGEVRGHNLLAHDGMELLAILSSGSGLPTMYMGLMGANATPVATWRAHHFSIIGGELLGAPEGYDEADRQLYQPLDTGSGVINNAASPCAFTIRTASSIPIYGVGLIAGLTGATKRSTGPLPVDLTTRTDSIDTGAATGVAEYGFQHVTSIGNPWYDPGGDDFFDGGLGYWVDPGNDSFEVSIDDNLIAAARFPGAPLSFNNMDPLNVTWQLQVST